jgi:hypothetical protein
MRTSNPSKKKSSFICLDYFNAVAVKAAMKWVKKKQISILFLNSAKFIY